MEHRLSSHQQCWHWHVLYAAPAHVHRKLLCLQHSSRYPFANQPHETDRQTTCGYVRICMHIPPYANTYWIKRCTHLCTYGYVMIQTLMTTQLHPRAHAFIHPPVHTSTHQNADTFIHSSADEQVQAKVLPYILHCCSLAHSLAMCFLNVCAHACMTQAGNSLSSYASRRQVLKCLAS